MKAMRQARLGDPWRVLEAVETDPPTPGDGAVRIRVEASDLNFADILQCRGSYQVKRTPPFTPGMNAAGTVVEAGPGTVSQVGARLIGPTVEPAGGFAEEALVLERLAHPIPDGVSTADAMGIHITYGTAWLALKHRAAIQPGETVLVLAAAGGVGSAAVQMARRAGCWVVAAAGGPQKADFAARLGADAAIDYSAVAPSAAGDSTHQALYDAVMGLTDGRGVDVVFDPVGGGYFDVARRLLAWEGRHLVIGFASGEIPNAPANHLLVKNYSLVGVHMGGYRERRPDLVRRCYEELHSLLAAGEIAAQVTETVGFDGLPEALRRLAARQTIGRVLFDPGLSL